MLALLVRPRFWPGHLAMVVCVAIAAGLGVWQYDAWHRHRVDAARDLVNAPAEPLGSVMTGDSAFPSRSSGQPVTFSGTWLGADTVFVSDREHDGRTGYWVVTPALVTGVDSAMPIVRGWSAEPTAPPVDGSVEVTGWLQPSEADDAIDDDPSDAVIPSMRVASLVAHVDEDLYSGFVIARVPAPTGDLQPVRPAKVPGVSGFTGLRNLLYGIEWWVFAAFAVFIWVRWCRDSLAIADQDSSDSGDLETSEA